jgi:hypothetical protein
LPVRGAATTGVAGCEIKLLVIERIIRDVHLAIDTRQRPIRVDHDGGVVVQAGRTPLEKRRDDDDVGRFRELLKRLGRWTGDGLGELKEAVILRLTEVLGAKELLRADDLRAGFGRLFC